MKQKSNEFERLFKLWAMICKMVIEGARDPKMVAEKLQAIVDQKVVVVNNFLRRLYDTEEIKIGATNGAETIAQARELFAGYLDSDFENWGLGVSGKETPETFVAVHKQIMDGTFTQIFKSLGKKTDQFCLTQNQIIEFCRTHREKLRTDGYATFFLFKVKGKFFVARVVFDGSGHLEVYVYHFSLGRVWSAEFQHRFVIPQLES